MNTKLKGTLCGLGAAVSYGLNPLGSLPMYAEGVNTNTVLIWRYGLALLMLAAIMVIKRMSFRITMRDAMILLPLGTLFAVSSISLFESFHHMDSGMACTMLFSYPVMVAVMMAIFFKERLTLNTVLSITLALAGIALLYRGDGGATLSAIGVSLVLVSSLTYALYIIILNKSPLRMSSVKLTFYVLLIGSLAVFVNSILSDFMSSAGGVEAHMLVSSSSAGADSTAVADTALHLLRTPSQWLHAAVLALCPTVLSLLLMTTAIHCVGSTPTAIMGALEPITAVAIGVLLFGETFTPRLATGILLVLAAVTLIIIGKSLSVHSMTHVITRLGRVITKHWRWK